MRASTLLAGVVVVTVLLALSQLPTGEAAASALRRRVAVSHGSGRILRGASACTMHSLTPDGHPRFGCLRVCAIAVDTTNANTETSGNKNQNTAGQEGINAGAVEDMIGKVVEQIGRGTFPVLLGNVGYTAIQHYC